MLYRLETTHSGSMMPEFSRSLVHEESVALIRCFRERMKLNGLECLLHHSVSNLLSTNHSRRRSGQSPAADFESGRYPKP